jgi:uncharacterized membrane protein
MKKNRLEAFSDGVIAIILTILVLEFKVPHGSDFSELTPLLPKALSYLLSFLYIGIYWNNHHHLFQVVDQIRGVALWANMHLLLWLSLMPFATAWMGENHFARQPVFLYGLILTGAGFAYWLLVKALLRHHQKDSKLARAIGKDLKGRISILIYLISLAASFIHPWISCGLFVLVAIIWLIPDRRIENIIDA